jgi:hypothetical protein
VTPRARARARDEPWREPLARATSKTSDLLPIPTLATVFEVVAAGRLYCVNGAALQKWILQKQQKWKGPKGFLFSQRPTL